MSSQQSQLCAVFFMALVLTLHVPAVAMRDALTDSHLQRDTTRCGTDKEEVHSAVFFHQKVPADVVDIHNTSGHSALSSVTHQTIERPFERGIGETFVQDKLVINSSLVMITENQSFPAMSHALFLAAEAGRRESARIKEEFNEDMKRMGLSVTNAAGAGKTIGVLSGASIPTVMAVTLTVVASAGAVVGAFKAAATYFKKKRNKTAMEKCEVRHHQVTISLALIGLAGTAASIAFPPLAVLGTVLGLPASILSIINRHKGRKALCRRLQKRLKKNLEHTVGKDGKIDLQSGIQEFDRELAKDMTQAYSKEASVLPPILVEQTQATDPDEGLEVESELEADELDQLTGT